MKSIGMRRRLAIAASFLIPVFLYCIVMIASKTFPFGEESLFLWDAWEQDSAFLPYWRGVLTGENDLLYSFSRGLGYSMVGMIGFYLASPLNILLLAFPQSTFPLAFHMLILLRIGLCGMTFYVFLNKVYGCGVWGLLFSTSYALMGTIAAYVFRIMWLDAYVLLPIVALGIVRIIGRQKPGTYLAALGLTILSNYYMGYMVCLFSVLYFVYRLLCRAVDHPFQKGELKRIFFNYILSSLLAVGLTAFLLVPVIAGLTQGYQLFDVSLLSLEQKFTVSGMLTKLYTGAISITQIRDGLPNIYIGIPLLVFIPLYFFNPNIKRRKRLLSFGLVLVFIASFQISALYYAWHAFERPTYYAARFSFLFSFILIEAAWQGFDMLGSLSPRRRGMIALASGIAFLTMTYLLFRELVIDYLAYKTIVMDAVFFAITCVLVLFMPADKRKRWYILLLCAMQAVCLLLNSYYPIVRLREKDYTSVTEYTQTTTQAQELVDRVQEDDDGLYRMAMNDSYTHNDPMLYGYAGITHSNSDISQAFMEFAEKLGFEEIIFRTKYGNGISPVLESLFGFKYVMKTQDITHSDLLDGYELLWTDSGTDVYENTYALSIAYLVPPETYELSDDNPFQNQNTLLSDLTGESIQVFETISDYQREYDGEWETYIFSVQPERYMYLWSMGTLYQLNGEEAVNREHYAGTILLPVTEEETVYTLQMTEPLGIYLAYFDLEAFQDAYAILAEYTVEVTSDTDSHLVIEAEVTDDHTQLLITLPYDAGWKAWVDGERVETTSRYGALLAVDLTEGTHTVELIYTPGGLWAGLAISLLSLAGILVWMLRKKKNG